MTPCSQLVSMDIFLILHSLSSQFERLPILTRLLCDYSLQQSILLSYHHQCFVLQGKALFPSNTKQCYRSLHLFIFISYRKPSNQTDRYLFLKQSIRKTTIRRAWRNGSAFDSRSKGWVFESPCPQFFDSFSHYLPFVLFG